MIKFEEFKEVCKKSIEMIEAAGLLLTPEDKKKITAADFGLSDLKKEGIQILTMFQTNRIAGKILVLLPYQTEPEHWHPTVGDDAGKEEVIRAISGELYFYIPGENNMKHGFIVDGKEDCYTMRNEVVMSPGDQLELPAGTKHWFQAGEKGAVMYSFSTTVTDLNDQFTDPNIVRNTIIEKAPNGAY
ncbi:D-lyxose/D-mannose family sugar isomerase [Flavivirga rizhaonensis]|uniref:D-lyxose ketol-isomerase n=1 Tax=Flavivirga rizhaonensis TaxID=2559571 RepID=A0A4S1DTN4_9FLAO|nr:D-lyxose/D-mannose family sugar isomerase [Flavivirga rizhaonensis]TGV01309.1 D-lyxose/D-mannose family sugar isomerase [Flavivirga rizhaonensis]